MGFHLPTTKPFTLVLALAGRETMEREGDRLGTEDLLLALAREGESVAARVLLEARRRPAEAQGGGAAQYAAAVDPEPFPPDRGPPPWQPPPSARLRRVVPLTREHSLPSGDQLVLISLEVWWTGWTSATRSSTPPRSRRASCRPEVIGVCEVSDRAGTEYVELDQHPSASAWSASTSAPSSRPAARHGAAGAAVQPAQHRSGTGPARCSSAPSTCGRPGQASPDQGRVRKRRCLLGWWQLPAGGHPLHRRLVGQGDTGATVSWKLTRPGLSTPADTWPERLSSAASDPRWATRPCPSGCRSPARRRRA